MKTDHWWAPLTGIAFLVVLIAGFIVGGEPPDAGNSAQEIANWYRDNDSSAQFAAIMVGLAGVLLIFFAGTLRQALRRAEGEGHVLSLVAFAGAVILAVGAAFDATILFALADASDKIEPAQMQTLQALWDNDFIPIAMGTQVFLLASGLSIVRHGALAAWMGWVAIALGVVGLTPIGFAAFLGGAVWIAVASVMLALRARSAGATAQPTAPPPVASPAA
jgi:hypothetical protein